MTPAPGERDRICAAMDRILTGTHERSSGALTIVPLAIEADVPRNALTQRHTDLKDEFYRRIRERGADNGEEARLRVTIARLRQTIAAKNKELAQLRADVPASSEWSISSRWRISSSATRPLPPAAASCHFPAVCRSALWTDGYAGTP